VDRISFCGIDSNFSTERSRDCCLGVYKLDVGGWLGTGSGRLRDRFSALTGTIISIRVLACGPLQLERGRNADPGK
jgi:hypothetical protein